jgi:hypothetical protein
MTNSFVEDKKAVNCAKLTVISDDTGDLISPLAVFSFRSRLFIGELYVQNSGYPTELFRFHRFDGDPLSHLSNKTFFMANAQKA